ncbi:MAG: hypothetical protein NTW14_07485 [bacterium]|nr:hypothetical protein [bacterium]
MKNQKHLLLCLVLLACSLGALAQAALFPKDDFIPGWKSGETRTYSGEQELSTYIDGGAVVYTDFYFEGLAVQEYQNQIGGHLTIEIYKFSYPEDACGVNNQDTVGTFIDLGQDGRATDYAAHFWKDNLYVRAFMWEMERTTEGVALFAAREVEKKIKDLGKLPPWLDSLYNIGQQVCFLRKNSALKRIAGNVLPDSIEIPDKSGAAWVRSFSADLASCLVVNCPNQKAADSLFVRLGAFLRTSSTGVVFSDRMGFGRRSDGKAQALEKIDRFVFWVPYGRDEEVGSNILDLVRKTLINKEKKP